LEHILLDHKSHENDKFAYEKIALWLSKLLSADFLGKEIVMMQLTGATYELYGKCEYISVKFTPNSDVKYPYNVRVPIGMVAKQANKNIVDFLLHIVDGFVDEMEIYNMDLTEFCGNICIENVTYRIDEQVVCD